MDEEQPTPPTNRIIKRKEADPAEEPAERPQAKKLAELGEKTWPTFSFKIPTSARIRKTDPKIVVLRELDPDLLNEVRRIKNKEESGDRAVILSLWSVDGRQVDHSEDEGMMLWHSWSQKVRTLISLGWQKVNSTSDDEDEAFLSSMAPE